MSNQNVTNDGTCQNTFPSTQVYIAYTFTPSGKRMNHHITQLMCGRDGVDNKWNFPFKGHRVDFNHLHPIDLVDLGPPGFNTVLGPLVFCPPEHQIPTLKITDLQLATHFQQMFTPEYGCQGFSG